MNLFEILYEFSKLSSLEKEFLYTTHFSVYNHYILICDVSEHKESLNSLVEKGWITYRDPAYDYDYNSYAPYPQKGYYLNKQYKIFFQDICKLEKLLNL